jgi:HAE1 family hydrophobic/amphiphilic exporter-1
MNLIQAFVRHPVSVSVGVLLVALFGVVALDGMPMQLTPEVETPTLTIDTTWPGASPQEVEREIVVEQEEQLKGVEGVRKMSSESMDSRGVITMEFLVGTNMEEALLKVNSRLQQVREYPDNADLPVITTANSSNRPIAWFMLSPRLPTEARLDEFAAANPQLAEKLAPIRSASSMGVAMLRLRKLAEADPAFVELLPPKELDVTKLRRFAEDEIESRFERVAGVSQANVMGGLEDELQVVVDPEKLAARQVTLSEVRRVLQAENQDTPAGDFWEGKRRYVVRSLGQFRSIQQVEDQLLAVRDGAPVYVRDVARVQHGYKKPDGVVQRFGESNIAVNCIREPGSNILEVMAELRTVNRELNDGLLQRQGLELTQVYDETDYIRSSIKLVTDNIYVGGALTMIVLMMFLNLGVRALLAIPLILGTALAAASLSPWYFAICLAIVVGAGFWFARGALVVALAIPISIVGTFLILGLMGRSLNVISLAGLAFAVGMLVDNAVVVLENIYRHYDEGAEPFDAAIRGTQEVWGAVVASTLTTLAVFIPVIFIQEEAGQLFADIALAISAAVGLSLLVSVTVIPPAAARLFRRRTDGAAGSTVPATELRLAGAQQPTAVSHVRVFAIVRWIERFGVGFVNLVTGANAWIQRTVLRRMAVVATMIAIPMTLSWLFWPPVEYLPRGNRNLVFGILLPPPGYNLDQLVQLGKIVEAQLRPYWDTDPGTPEAAKLDAPLLADFFFVARGRQVFIGVRSADDLRAGELERVVQLAGLSVPGAMAIAKQASLFEQGLTEGRTVDVEITGPDIERLVALGGQIMGQVPALLPGATPIPKPSLDLSSPEVHLTPKLVQAAEMEMTASDLGFAANALVDGAYVGDYFLDGKKIDLTVVGETKFAQETHRIGAVPIATPLGQLVPLNALADVELSSGPEQINHRERVRAITIQVSPRADMALEEAMTVIRTKIVDPLSSGGQLDGGYQINLAGTADKLRQTWRAMSFNVYLAMAITYLLMAALFESWLYPLVIILTVPLSAAGGILALRLLNVFVLQPLDVLTMLGFVILIGTVVNNPILIVHQALNYVREHGMSPREAVLESARTRIRPIFVTTITTLLGLLPLVLFPGAGSELYRGLGSVMLGGLLVSTLFTLVLTPTLFTLTMDARQTIVGWVFGGAAEGKEARPAYGAEPYVLEEPKSLGAAVSSS